MMHTLEVVVPCHVLISGLLMTPAGSGPVRLEGATEVLGPRTLYFEGLEGCTELRGYLGASKALVFCVVCSCQTSL